MNRKHLLYMVLGCALPLAALLAITVFQLEPGRVVLYGLLLLCPAMHLFMLREHLGQSHNHEGHSEAKLDTRQVRDIR